MMKQRFYFPIRFLAAWLISAAVLTLFVGPAAGAVIGLIIAICYINAIYWKLVYPIGSKPSQKL